MSDTRWTPQQELAIKTKYLPTGDSCNILVGAAAGSGKTAVLVERVIKKLLPENLDDAVDADKLLIVTFTNAAAREMSERIDKALSKEVEKATLSGDSERKKLARRQMLLLPQSDITTIDAFCMKLLRRNFALLDLDPAFSIADTARAKMFSEEAMEEIFDELYTSGDEEFLDLLGKYATNRSDDKLSSLVLSIYSYICSIPYPLTWLSEKTEELALCDGIENAAWFGYAKKSAENKLKLIVSCMRKGLCEMLGSPVDDKILAENPPVPDTPAYDEWGKVYKIFYDEYLLFLSAENAGIDKFTETFGSYSFPSLTFPPSKKDAHEPFATLRSKEKDLYTKIKTFTDIDKAELETLYREKLYPTALAILKLVRLYSERYMQKKLQNNLLEFNDIEQLSLMLLTEHPNVRAELQNTYHEILMDEYQDTSPLQEAIFSLISDGKNLFMVGDMKQSIYRFRNSDPTIFKSKNDLYEEIENAQNRKIILSKNFRSRSEVLESVNDVFEAIMTEEAGELRYDESQRLYLGDETYQNINPSYISECCIVEGAKDYSGEDFEKLSKQEAEARFIASEICRLKAEHFMVRDGGRYREIQNRDIVILMTSFKSAADSFISELNNAGIDCFVESTNYFERNEIRLMLALLKIINNPYSDIPLLAIMRSPIAAFSDDELAIIRSKKRGKFFTALKEIVSLYEAGELDVADEIAAAKKAADFYENLNRWRGYARFMSSDKLIWTLYEETDFYAFCGALHDGEEAQANLNLLFDRAKQYEQSGFQGLFNFSKYMEDSKKRDEKIQSAKLIGEGHDVVRIMTIHKSKGLEFPVVFVAGGSNQFNRKTDESRFILHKDFGISMTHIDYEEGYTYTPPSHEIFKEIQNTESGSEDIRRLYVAFTRAKEKLYFVGYVPGKILKNGNSELEEKIAKWKMFSKNMTPHDVLSAGSFADWVCPVAMKSKNWSFRTAAYAPSVTEENSKKDETPEKIDINIDDILSYSYPYADVSLLPTKVFASSLNDEAITPTNPMPAFLSSDEKGGASYGSCVHKILEKFVPFENMTESDVKNAIKALADSGEIATEDIARVNPKKILAFYNSSIGQRIMASDKVYREQSFEVEIDASLIYPDAKNAAGEKVLLQGMIDCYFEEDDGIVLVDYKTDVYQDPAEIHKKYDTQLSLYALALEKITKKSIKNRFFYLFFDDTVV